jgi:cytochrome oxidase Cu insertion factor (SCO1/SenC/PrrC family)
MSSLSGERIAQRGPSVQRLLWASIGAVLIASLVLKTVGFGDAVADVPLMTFDPPTFQLTERSGQAVSNDDLSGCVYIADFVFTRCSGPCARMSSLFEDLQRDLPTRPDLKLVSITVDPAYDTEERLTTYAKTYNADAERWLFLRGGPDEIKKLAVQGFKLGLQEGDPAKAEDLFIHSQKLVLVDQEGRIRNYYDSDDPAAVERLKLDALALLP